MRDKTKSDKGINAIQHHKGIPVNPQKDGEWNVWKRFLDWLVPSISNEDSYVKSLKDTTIESKHRDERDAKNVIELATSIEKDKISKIDFSRPMSKLELAKDIKELKEKIKLLEIKYGSRIDLNSEFKDGIFPKDITVSTSDVVYEEHENHMRKLLKTSLEDLDLGVRAYNALNALKINTLAELVKYDTHELLKFKNFGKKSLVEIEELLQRKGLTFGMDLRKYRLDEE